MKAYKLILTVAGVAFILAATAAPADTFYSRGDGDWDKKQTWSDTECGGSMGSGVPAAGDTVYVCVGDTVTVDEPAQAGDVTVQDSSSDDAGILSLEAGGELEIDSSLDVEDTEDYPGVFRFNAASGATPVLESHAYPMTIDGPITVTGSQGGEIARYSTYTVTLNSGATITNSSGPLTISAPMQVDGTVEANSANLFRFTAAPLPASSGKFLVSHSSAEMRFGHGSGLTITGGADFEITQGQMTFDETVQTNGGARVKGKIVSAAGKTFTATGDF